MDILVTGGAGFIGSHVAEYFSKKEDSVTVVDNLSRAEVLSDASDDKDTSAANWEFLDSLENVEKIEGDVRDKELVEELAEGKDAIIHLAGQVAVTSSIEDPEEDFSTNARGTFNVVEAARKAESDPKVIFTSTNKVYGNNVNHIEVEDTGNRYEYAEEAFSEGIPESLSIDDCEHTPYGTSKLAGDLYVQDYAYRNEIDAALFRMSCIFGTRQYGVEDQGWLAHFIISTLEDEGLTIFGDGKQVRDVLWVKDLVRAFESYLVSDTDKVVFNMGGGNENTVSLLELLDIIEEETGERTDIEFDDWRAGDQKVYISDINRAEKELEWSPRVEPKEAVRKFINWYKSNE
jgi:CDP-paratose 2-epimerase